ncbi:MAG: MlaD family protein [Candidatus Omnitrophota bacterium]
MSAFSMSEVKVGLMVAISAALIVSLTISVGNYESLLSSRATVSIYVDNVVGLDNFAPVTYAGVKIGAITGIRYDEEKEQALIVAKIDLDYPVSLDSNVQVTSAGLLSPFFINISKGSAEQRIKTLLENGKLEKDKIILNATPNYTIGEVFSLAGDLKKVLAKVETALDGIGGPIAEVSGFISSAKKDVTEIMGKIQVILEDSQPRIASLLNNASGLIDSASENVIPALQSVRMGAAGLPGLVTDAGRGMNDIMSQASGFLRAASPETIAAIRQAKESLAALDSRIQTIQDSLVKAINDADHIVVDNREDIDQIILNLKNALGNLDDMSSQLAKNPWRLVWKTEERKEPMRVSPEWNPLPIIETQKP